MEEQNSSLNGQREPLWLTLKEQKMTIAIDKDGNVIELYGLPTTQGGGGGTGTEYTAKNPISITNNKRMLASNSINLLFL